MALESNYYLEHIDNIDNNIKYQSRLLILITQKSL